MVAVRAPPSQAGGDAQSTRQPQRHPSARVHQVWPPGVEAVDQTATKSYFLKILKPSPRIHLSALEAEALVQVPAPGLQEAFTCEVKYRKYDTYADIRDVGVNACVLQMTKFVELIA